MRVTHVLAASVAITISSGGCDSRTVTSGSADGPRVLVVEDVQVINFDWSPRCPELLVVDDAGVWALTVGGTREEVLAAEVAFARWSPDGARAALLLRSGASETMRRVVVLSASTWALERSEEVAATGDWDLPPYWLSNDAVSVSRSWDDWHVIELAGRSTERQSFWFSAWATIDGELEFRVLEGRPEPGGIVQVTPLSLPAPFGDHRSYPVGLVEPDDLLVALIGTRENVWVTRDGTLRQVFVSDLDLTDVDPAGRYAVGMLLSEMGDDVCADLWSLSLRSGSETMLTDSPECEMGPRLSDDGRFAASVSRVERLLLVDRLDSLE